MASKINADEFVDREGEGKPTLPKGVVLSGVTTITTAVVDGNEVANSTGINAGIITSTHFKGNLTGDVNAGIVTVTSQTVVGSAVTISASGIDIGAGVITATSYAGSGANLSGIGATIMVWEYNPDPYDSAVTLDTGIGITFNQKIKAGSGNITLRKDSSSGALVENFGIGSSVTIVDNELSFTPSSDLEVGQLYHLSYPSGVITNMAGDSYVGTAYTFFARESNRTLHAWGVNSQGQLGQGDVVDITTSIGQIPGTNWVHVDGGSKNGSAQAGIKADGTLWAWGNNSYGFLGQNNRVQYSSPVQIPGTTWSICSSNYANMAAVKTDGTLWVWGRNTDGALGQSSTVHYSSPVQVPGTTWSQNQMASLSVGDRQIAAIKTDGSLYTWGRNDSGILGNNTSTGTGGHVSSPIQIPGTWSIINLSGFNCNAGVKSNGELYIWGTNESGRLGLNQPDNAKYSSPVQIPGTTWKTTGASLKVERLGAMAIKTDGSLWLWGSNAFGNMGLNQGVGPSGGGNSRSSPTQVGSGYTWDAVSAGYRNRMGKTTDGKIWNWGNMAGYRGDTPNNDFISSPTQIGSDTTWTAISMTYRSSFGIKSS